MCNVRGVCVELNSQILHLETQLASDCTTEKSEFWPLAVFSNLHYKRGHIHYKRGTYHNNLMGCFRDGYAQVVVVTLFVSPYNCVLKNTYEKNNNMQPNLADSMCGIDN